MRQRKYANHVGQIIGMQKTEGEVVDTNVDIAPLIENNNAIFSQIQSKMSTTLGQPVIN